MQDPALAFDCSGQTQLTAKSSPVFTLDPFKLRAKARAKSEEATNEAESFNLLDHDYNNNNNFDSQDLTVEVATRTITTTTTALARELEEPPPPYLQTRKATMPPERERDPELAEPHGIKSDCVDTECCHCACTTLSPRLCAVCIIVLVFLQVVGFVLWAWSPKGQRPAVRYTLTPTIYIY